MKKTSKNKIIRIAAGSVALAVIFGIYLFCIQSRVAENVFFRVDSGAGISHVASGMRARNLIASENILKASVILLGGRVISGEYEIPRNASAVRIARMLNKGRIASTTVMIPEGMTVLQIKNLLLENETMTGDAEHGAKDGELFPDTYRVPRGAARSVVFDLARKKMDSVRASFESSGKRYPKPLESWSEVVTLASIVQKETPKVSEMPVVASVYLNRLKKKMRLQADPTVVYAVTKGLGDMRGQVFKGEYLKIDSPYNTYRNYGLPPGPIANVGRDAIRAVLNPADTTYLYFVADGRGGHSFSRTYDEHKKNHAGWRRIKKALNAKK
jgi:UPF0755 protein